MPRWEDVKNDPKPNLKELLRRKRKRNEVPTIKSNNLLHYIKVKTPNNK